MEDSLLPHLKKCTRKVVREAHKPDGLIDKGEFTIAVARRMVTQAMGLEDGALDEKPWKQVVKEEVKQAMDEVDAGSEEGDGDKPGPSRSASPVAPKPSKTKGEPKSDKAKSDKGSSSAERKKKGDSQEKTSVVEDDAGDRSESEMSSVYDEAPKRRKKGADSGSVGKDKSKKRTKKDPDEGLSPDEAKVAVLKRIVVACGVRKIWSKEFADCPTPSSQIRHLQNLLSSLGMKGTPTVGKAKSLKEKRELAAELDEVREFGAKRGVHQDEDEDEGVGRRASRSRDKGKSEEVIELDPNEEEDEGDQKSSALHSILDFLGDQSDQSD